MKFLIGFFSLQWLRVFDFLPPLAIRLLLAPILWVSGSQRLGLFTTTDNIVWYNPLTWVNTTTLQTSAEQFSNTVISGLGAETLTLVVGGIEVLGAVLLILGFAVRWIVPAVICVLLYLAYLAFGFEGIGEEAGKFVWQHGYITLEHSQFEMYVTYLILLLTLFFMGAGRWFSLDWFIFRRFMRGVERKEAKQAMIANRPPRKHIDIDPFEIDATDEPGLSRRRAL